MSSFLKKKTNMLPLPFPQKEDTLLMLRFPQKKTKLLILHFAEEKTTSKCCQTLNVVIFLKRRQTTDEALF